MEPRIIERARHNVSRKLIDPDALKILYRLRRFGHEAYLVGGCVRDILLERSPKDYDIATGAHPFEVKKLFRNCRIIGRRFRLAHVFFGQKIIEVATFRRKNAFDSEEDPHQGENTFGTAEEDALRRDFTCNGLFYDVGAFRLIDYVGGMEDIEAGVLRVIGDPDVRFCEDPVRMLRGVRFSARTGLALDADARRATRRHAHALWDCAPARIYEELLHMFRHGVSVGCFDLMGELGLMEALLPEVWHSTRRSGKGAELLGRYLTALDSLVAAGRDVRPAVFIAVAMAPLVREVWVAGNGAEGESRSGHTLRDVVEDTLAPVVLRFRMPRAVARGAAAALADQKVLAAKPRPSRRTAALVQSEHFADSLTLYEIHARGAGRGGENLAAWQALAEEGVDAPPAKRRRRRRRRRGGTR